MLLNQAKDQYLRHMQSKDCSNETIRGYRILLSEFVRFTESSSDCRELEDIIVEDIEGFLSHRKVLGDMASSRNRHFYILRSFFNYLYTRELISRNITLKLDPIKTSIKERRYMEPDTIAQLISHVENDIMRTAITTLAYTGLRVSELCSLRMADVNLVNRVIMIVNGKGNKDRPIPISDKLYNVFLVYLENVRPHTRSYYFFATKRHPTISPDYVNKCLKVAALEMGLDFKPTAHILRHSFASALIAGNAPLPSIQKLLGHADLRITSRYIHQNIDQLREAVNLL